MCYLLEREDFADVNRELTQCLTWNIHLPSSFPHHATRFDGGSQAFNDLVECVAKTGMLCAGQCEARQLVSECIKAIHVMADDCLSKTSGTYGFDEPRALEKACYLGVLALKRGWLDLFDACRAKVREFEVQYFAKYLAKVPPEINPKNHNVLGLPHHDQLLRELLKWRRDLRAGQHMRLMGDSQTMMASLVDVRDIDRFIFEVWRVRLAGSRIEADLRDARAKLLTALDALLTRRISSP